VAFDRLSPFSLMSAFGESTTSEQTLQAILSQLDVVVKKNDELTQKVGELQGTVNRLTDQSAEVELLKHNLQKVTQELEAVRGEQKIPSHTSLPGVTSQKVSACSLSLAETSDIQLQGAKAESTGTKRPLSADGDHKQEALPKQSHLPDAKGKGKPDEPPFKRLKTQPAMAPSSPTTRVSSRTRTRSKRLMVAENAMLEDKPAGSSPAHGRVKASPPSPAPSHKEGSRSPLPSSSNLKAKVESPAKGKGTLKKVSSCRCHSVGKALKNQ
jgi:hypothetical protein